VTLQQRLLARSAHNFNTLSCMLLSIAKNDDDVETITR
jgi:hypothetical protein